jgi:cytochrome c oxidase subunit 3
MSTMRGALAKEPTERRKMHPHKFALWLAIGSITMMFAGLTSAYMVRQGQPRWRSFDLPDVFTVSTGVILLSSLTMMLGVRAFKKRAMRQYRMLMMITLLLGIAFGVLQAFGFYQLYSEPQVLRVVGEISVGAETVRVDGNTSESFLFIITGLHLVHILGGIIALLIVFLKAYGRRTKVYNSTGLEIIGTYWHFVDFLWIYLFVFLLFNR